MKHSETSLEKNMTDRTHRAPETALRAAAGLLAVTLLTGFHGCLDDGHGEDAARLRHTLFVAHSGGSLVSYDIATGKALPGEIPGMAGPSDMQILENGILMVNLTDSNKILAVDARTMLELERIPSSAGTATRPVHSYLTNELEGERYWVAMNDGAGTRASNSARFVQVKEGHADYLKAVGEVPLGIGHHKAAWSTRKERGVISSIGDTNDILTVVDYANIGDIRRVATLDWKAAGLDFGKPASPHGCGISKASGKGYCNLTGPGWIAAVDMDAAEPAFKMIRTSGSGGGYTAAHTGGRYVYSMQTVPREGQGGARCQVGQIAVVDADRDSLVEELAVFLTGPDCTDSIGTGDQRTAGPGHILFTQDGRKAYVGMASGFADSLGRSRVQLVLDVSDPAHPRQLASVGIGASVSHHADILSGDGKDVFVANNQDATVTHIDAGAGTVVRTLAVGANPKALASFGEEEGPSHQTGPAH
jgi:hypothetical protein